MHHTQGTADWGVYRLISFGLKTKNAYTFNIDKSRLCTRALDYIKYSDVAHTGTRDYVDFVTMDIVSTSGTPLDVPDSFYNLVNVLLTHPNTDKIDNRDFFIGLCALGEVHLTPDELYTRITELNQATENSLEFNPISEQFLLILPELKHLLHTLKHSEVIMDLTTVYSLQPDNSGKPLTDEYTSLLEVLFYLLLQIRLDIGIDEITTVGYRETMLNYLNQLFSGYTYFSLNLALSISAKMGTLYYLSVSVEQLLELIASDVQTFYMVNKTYPLEDLIKYVNLRLGV